MAAAALVAIHRGDGSFFLPSTASDERTDAAVEMTGAHPAVLAAAMERRRHASNLRRAAAMGNLNDRLSLGGAHEPRTSNLEPEIARRVKLRLRESRYASLQDLVCEESGGTLWLRGRVPTQYLRQLALGAASRSAGERVIMMDVEVVSPSAPATARRPKAPCREWGWRVSAEPDKLPRRGTTAGSSADPSAKRNRPALAWRSEAARSGRGAGAAFAAAYRAASMCKTCHFASRTWSSRSCLWHSTQLSVSRM